MSDNDRIEKRFIGMSAIAEMSSDPTPIPIIKGIAPVFNAISEVMVDPELGLFREVIEPGALDGIMDKLDVRARFDHKVLLGRTKNGTLSLTKTEKGLEWMIFVNPDDREAMDAYSKVRRRDADGSSFMFVVAQGTDTWEMQDGIPLRRVHEISELMDVGPVTFPAYPQTSADTRSKIQELRQSQQQQPPAQPEGDAGAQTETDQTAAESQAHELELMSMEIEIDQDKEIQS